MALPDRETTTCTSQARPRTNGNATQDANRNIGSNGIVYSVHNLVQQVTITGGATLTYLYDGAGAKLRMANSNGAVNTKYAGAFEYNQANYLTRISTEEGQITVTNNGNDFAFEYYLKDHLGNTRSVMNEAGTLTQETEYFPFGLAIPRTAGTNKYTFLGKEKQPETGWMDLTKRSYDPTVGRFIQVDPITDTQENYSTYQYGWNNPILRSDPNGDCPKCPNGQYLRALTNPITAKGLKYATDNQQKVASVKLGIGLGENYGLKVFGKGVNVGALIGYNEVTIGTGGVDYSANGLKGTATANFGPISAGGEINVLNLNINFREEDGSVNAINGNFSISGEQKGKTTTKSGSIASAGEATLSVAAGPLNIGLSGSLEALKNTISGYIQAATGFVQSVLTEVTNNTFNTDTAGRNTEQFIKEEREPKR